MIRPFILTILALGALLVPRTTISAVAHHGSGSGVVEAPRLASRFHLRPLSRVHAVGGRALVALPFREQTGADSGYQEIKDLNDAGFKVDVWTGDQVTVRRMESLAQYNVVYIMTHGGVNDAYGEANVVTGQLADNDPAVLPLFGEYSISKATVADKGDTQYWAMMSNFIRYHVGHFAPNALIYVDTCGLLRATQWWDALLARQGAGVLVSWDQDSQFRHNIPTAARFFDDLLSGATVDAALHDVKAHGLGTSVDITADKPVPAHLGYVGHGGITLLNAVTGDQPHDPTPTPTPAATPSPAATVPAGSPTAVPTPRPTATPTATPAAPLPLRIQMLRALAPGQRQIVTVYTAPRSSVTIHVAFPNGEHQLGRKTADANGVAIYRYHQRSSLTTHNHFDARVSITVISGSRSAQAQTQYRVLFGPIDLSAEPRDTQPGGEVRIWVHAKPYAHVTLTVHPPDGAPVLFRATTGPRGWAYYAYHIGGQDAPLGTAQVTATTDSGGKTVATSTSFTIL